MTRQHLSLLQIWNMCFGLFGVQIVWALQNANTSRIFQTLGAEVDDLAVLWIAAPLAGLLVQPIIGHMSDRTWGPLGRRRPYFFYGSILTAVALCILPNVTSVWAATVMLWVLCASTNVTMEPFRAFVADLLPERQRTTGFAMQVFFIGSGAVLASMLPWLLASWLGLDNRVLSGRLPQSVTLAFYLGAIAMLISVMWTVFTTPERAPEKPAGAAAPSASRERESGHAALLLKSGVLWTIGGLAAFAAVGVAHLGRELYLLAVLAAAFGGLQIWAFRLRRSGRSIGVLEVAEDIVHMPPTLKQLAIVQFFTWFGLFAMWIYATPAVTSRHYDTTDPTSASYNEGADWVGVLFATYNGIAAIAALLLPLLVARIGRRASHAVCLIFGALGFAGFLLIDDPALLWIPIVGIGVAWASIMSVPYAILSSAVPPSKMGVYMGIHNLFLVIPQLVAATVLGPLVTYVFKGEAIYALVLAGVGFALAALSSAFVRDRADTQIDMRAG